MRPSRGKHQEPTKLEEYESYCDQRPSKGTGVFQGACYSFDGELAACQQQASVKVPLHLGDLGHCQPVTPFYV